MIVAKCPLRVSLVGGSTDLKEFIEENGKGSVISFPCTLYTYISLFEDKNGFNKTKGKYIVNYTNREQESKLESIQNDIAREALDHFKVSPLTVSFNTDVFASGSGLASSSSYTVAITKALYRRAGLHTPMNVDICSDALRIEKKFNPLTGYQDAYGCGLGLFKRMDFAKTEDEVRTTTKVLNDSLFKNYDCYLIYTGQTRSSTDVLSSLDLNKAKELLPLVDEFENVVNRERYKDIFKIMNEGWKLKKDTSPHIISTNELAELDEKLRSLDSVLSYKLCGAGGGGYFVAFTEKNVDLSKKIKNFEDISFKIEPDKNGVQVCDLSGKVSVL